MSDLAKRQQAFLAAILDDAAPMPQAWGNSQAAGMDVYRGNYRSALMDVLADTFERTRRYVGQQPFRQVSMHHIITHPPAGWTIDEAGEGFAQTCAELFRDNPEAGELAWLEWALRLLATAPDSAPLTAQDFAAASADFGDEEWSNLRLGFAPRATARLVGHDLEALWRALGEEGGEMPQVVLPAPQCCLVWREGERPTFKLVEADHDAAFAAMAGGASYAEVIALLIGEDPEPSAEAIQQAAMRAGAMLGVWLNEGLVTALNP